MMPVPMPMTVTHKIRTSEIITIHIRVTLGLNLVLLFFSTSSMQGSLSNSIRDGAEGWYSIQSVEFNSVLPYI